MLTFNFSPKKMLCGSLLAACCASAQASPWIDAGNSRARHHIQFLVDSGAMNIPTSTWPLAWSSVKQALDDAALKELSDAQTWSWHFLHHELRKVTQSAYTQSRSHVSNSAPVLQGFEASAREAKEIQTGATLTGERAAMRLTATFVDDPSDGKKARLDGSYLALLLGNWATGVGAVDQWWGPGWHNSMMLSSHARPAPGLFIKRNRTDAASHASLHWLGQWQLTAFVNQLQNKTPALEKPLLGGARFSINPLQGLELGFSRTVMWQGDRINDNRMTAPSTPPPADQTTLPQHSWSLTGLDARWGFAVGATTAALYGQIVNERGAVNEQGPANEQVLNKPGFANEPGSGNVAMGGVELSRLWLNTHNRLVLEASNSASGFYKNASQNTPAASRSGYENTAYENTLYTAGYRHLGRAIGPSTDGDSEMVSLAGYHYFANGHQLTWRYSAASINKDGTNLAAPSGNAFGPAYNKVDSTQIQYRWPVNDRLMVALGGTYLRAKTQGSIGSTPTQLRFNGRDIDKRLQLSLFHHW